MPSSTETEMVHFFGIETNVRIDIRTEYNPDNSKCVYADLLFEGKKAYYGKTERIGVKGDYGRLCNGSWESEFVDFMKLASRLEYGSDLIPVVEREKFGIFFFNKEMRGMTREEGFQYWLKKQKFVDLKKEIDKEIFILKEHINNHSETFKLFHKILKTETMQADLSGDLFQ